MAAINNSAAALRRSRKSETRPPLWPSAQTPIIDLDSAVWSAPTSHLGPDLATDGHNSTNGLASGFHSTYGGFWTISGSSGRECRVSDQVKRAKPTQMCRYHLPSVGRQTRVRNERGAVAVEAAFVVPLLLFPLLFGIIQFGDYFWKAQRVDVLAPPMAAGAIAGDFGCLGLKDRVAAEVVAVVNALDPEIGGIDVGQVTVTVTEVLPDVGVTVEVHIEAHSGLASLIPLPTGNALVTEFSQRLSDVRITDATCR